MIPLVANGNVKPSRFVKADTTADNHCLQAGANDLLIGISQKGQRAAPYPGLQDGYAAIAGESLQTFQPTETAPLEIGPGGCVAGDYLEADTNGLGVRCTTDGHNYGAKTAVTAIEGQVIEVLVVIGQRGV